MDLPPPDGQEDILVLAGDIDNGIAGLTWAKEQSKCPVLYVPGNHEFYGMGPIGRTMRSISEYARDNGIHALVWPGDKVEIGDYWFVGGTLWTDFALFGEDAKMQVKGDCGHYMMDYRWIEATDYRPLTPQETAVQVVAEAMNGTLYRKLTTDDTEKLHRDFFAGLCKNVLAAKEAGKKVVVVTHHAPSIQSSAPKYRHDLTTGGYASRLEFMFEPPIVAWCHGHMHNTSAYHINGIPVYCNPRGYATGRRLENESFLPDLVIDLEDRSWCK